MKLLPRLCMATGTAAAADSDSGSSNKLGSTSTASSSSTSTSSSAAAAVSEASSSTSLPSLSAAATSNAASASFTHLATLLPLPTAATTPSPAAAVAPAPAADSVHHGHGFVVARPSSVSLHDLSTLDATSTSDSTDSTSAAGSVKCVAHVHGTSAAVTITGHQDGRLRLWRASTRSPDRIRLAAELPTVSDRLRRFPVPSNHVPVRRHHRRLWIEHADAVSGVAASADGRLLFSVSWDRTLKVWAVPSLRCLQSLPAHDDAVNAVAVAPDGTVYTASADTRVRVWAPRPDKTRSKKKPVYYLLATLSRHKAAVNAVAVGCGRQVLYSAGNDRCVVVWEREDSASHMVAIGALRGHRKAVLSVACAGNDGMVVVSGSADQMVRAWRREADGRGHTCVAVIDGHGSAVRSVAVVLVPTQKRRQGENGDEEWRVCSASFDGEVRVWSLRVTTGL